MAVKFMIDDTEGNGHCETIMDYVISWMLRRSQNECQNDPGKYRLFQYCRRFTGLLIGKEIQDDVQVSVETWKQYNHIDIWAHVVIDNESHDILIEDKYYSHLHDNQLERYKSCFDSWISAHRPDTHSHYILLSCKDSNEVGEYKDLGYTVYSWDNMVDCMRGHDDILMPSGSDIFDEFWINW